MSMYSFINECSKVVDRFCQCGCSMCANFDVLVMVSE